MQHHPAKNLVGLLALGALLAACGRREPPAPAEPEPAEAAAPAVQTGKPVMGGGPSDAFGGASRGSSDRAASQRGRGSLPQGARSKGGGVSQR